MQAKVSNLRKTHRQKAGNSSFVPSLTTGILSNWRNDPLISHYRSSIWNKVSRIGKEKAFGLAKCLENGLFIGAASQEEYMNQETLMQRLGTQLDKSLHAKNRSKQVDRSKRVPSSGLLHTWSNGTVLEPAFQKVAGPINNATDYCAVAVDNKYGYSEGGLSHSLTANEPVFLPDHNWTSSSTFTDMDALPNFGASGVGINLASYKSNSSYSPQQQPDNWTMDPIKYGDCSGTVQKNGSMDFNTTMGQSLQSESSNLLSRQHLSMEFSEVPNLASYKSNSSYFPQQQADNWMMDPIKYGDCSGTVQKNGSMDFNTAMGQSLQSESSNLLSRQHVSREFSEVSNLASYKLNSSYFPQQQADNWMIDPIKYGDCSGTVQKNGSMDFNTTMGQSLQTESSNLLSRQHVSRGFPEVSNISQGHYQHQKLDFEHEYSVQPQPDSGHQILGQKALSTSLGLDGSASKKLNVPVGEVILLEYLYYKKLNVPSNLLSNFLHSRVCSNGICNCAKYNDLLKHFDACQSDDCFTCYYWKSRGTDILERNLEFPNRVIMGSVVRKSKAPSGNSKAMPRPPKRRKMESAFSVPLINNASSGQLTHKMDQPCSPEASSKLKEQQESPPPGTSEPMPRLPERRKMESSFSVSFINNASSNDLIHKMVQPCSTEAFSELKQQQVSTPSSVVTECNVEEFSNPMLDSMSNGEIKNNVVDDTFGKILKNETILSKGLEADHISGEQDSKSHDEEARSNSEEANIRSNSIVHSTLCKKSIAVFIEEQDSKSNDVEASCNFVETGVILNSNMNTLCEEPMATFIEEPDPKSNDVEASSSFVETGVILNSNMNTLCEEPMATFIEGPDPKSNDVEASSTFVETGVILNSNMNTLCEEPMATFIEEPDPKSNDVEASSTFVETGVILNSNMNTLSEEPMATFIEEPDPKSNDVKASSNLVETGVILNSNMNSLCKEPKPGWDTEDIEGRTGFNQDGIELKADQEKETDSPNPTVNIVSLTDFFTSNQIREHITSLRKQFNQCTTIEEPGNDVYKCQLCGMGTLSFAPESIYCFCCGNRIKRNSWYYYRRDEDDAQHCFCPTCYKKARGGSITFNGTSVSKTDLDKKTNNREFEEAWVECNKCKSWQHSICALYNPKRDLDNSAVYTCPQCHLKEIENGMHVPLPKTAMFVAKDLPSTLLSDHIERRLFKRLKQESEDWGKVEGNNNLDEVLEAENLSVRVVTSVNKQLIVKKQFLDIFVDETYPTEFSYTSKVILLFQQIEGVDVCLFAMYVQEYGSECGNPNRNSVYISYLDSVKYFRPERQTMSGEALRTFVYHEILVGYLDFCKKRGFTTCYIWACPPIKGEDYILYCHPDTQKTPKKDKLRHWYHSMLSKAAEENIVVGLTNIYDQFFVRTSIDSKVTAACLPYFDGDFWSGAAMDKARSIEQESGGEYEVLLKKEVTKRTLKAMGHINPPSGRIAKDILVMQRLSQAISSFKEDFIVVQLHYVCMHCHEVIKSGKGWFCTECKKFQECERCHTADSHTSHNGENHRLSQVLVDDVLCGSKEKDIILDNWLFDTRHNFLSYCQRNRFQFDSLRRAKYSTMMILFLLNNPALLNVGTICRVCCKNVYQCYWKCENCPEFTVCSACYNERGSNCHAHTLTQAYSTAQCPSGIQELTQHSALIQELQDVIKHASQCHSPKTQPCTYPHCLRIKKLFSHAHRCTIRVSGGCQHCKKVWVGLAVHSRDCRDSGCRIPRCMDLKKQAEWIATQSESRRRAAVLIDC